MDKMRHEESLETAIEREKLEQKALKAAKKGKKLKVKKKKYKVTPENEFLFERYLLFYADETVQE